jgi:L-aspartate oxidase
LNPFPNLLPAVADSAPYLVIGSGIAGLTAALELCKTARVLLLTKGSLAESNTSYAQGGIAAVIRPPDTPELHYEDTLMAGAGLCDRAAVSTLVHEGPHQVQRLIELGVPFDRKDGAIALTREAAHSRRRILHANGDGTGRQISATLIHRAFRCGNLRIYEEEFAVALITRSGRCCGAVALHQGRLRSFLAGAVILASGGSGQLFGKTTNPAVATGDGMAMAYRAGAALRDLEFVQFHPTALYRPPAPPFLISEAVRGEGALLRNEAGQRFMPDYHELAELAPRDIVARSIFREIEKTGHPSVYLDLAAIAPDRIRERFPNIYGNCLKYGLDITREPIPVAPAAHYMMGGVWTDLWGKTSLPGLFAAGETAATGVHGANRLASNSLLEGLVFGARIAAYLAEHPAEPVPDAADPLRIHYPECRTAAARQAEDRRALHRMADHYLGIVRDRPGLERAAQLLKEIPPGPAALEPEYLELQNLLLLGELMVSAAQRRTESRGGHFRSDYPAPDPEWRKHILFREHTVEVSE